MRAALLLMLVACGGSTGGTVDAAVVVDADLPTGYQPDPVTMGENLPAAVPLVRVQVNGQTIERGVPIPGTIEIEENGTVTYRGPIEVEGRGNFTWSLPKKGYAFELPADGVVLGMPPGKDFALYACYTDKTCLRNALVFALGQELGRWSPRTRFVELSIDGSYRGLYMVWERVRRDATRVDVPKVGGYIVRHEGGGEGNGEDFTTTAGTVYSYHYPDVTALTAEQQAAVRGAFQQLEDDLAANPAGYAAWIDETSWLDRGIVEEVTNNWDGYVHSIYMTLDTTLAAGRFGMGPLWDFDLAFANGNVTGYNCRTDNWAYQIQRGYPDDVPAYWRALYADAGFQHAWKCRYQALRAGPLAAATFDARIAAWTAFTAAARARDQQVWPTVGQMIFPNCTSQPTYDGEVTYLRDWIGARLVWLDAQAAAMPGDCP